MISLNSQPILLVAGSDDQGKRLDAWTAAQLPELTRSYLQKLIEEEHVKVNQRPVKASYRIQAGDEVEVCPPPPRPIEAAPEELPLPVVYEDQDLLVIDKPTGMVVHPAVGNYQGTLVNALLAHCQDLSGIGGVSRPGIVHRLDKDTSGLLVVAKNDQAHQSLSAQIRERRAMRRYLALVHGVLQEPAGRIEADLGRHPVQRKKMAVLSRGGRNAVTHYQVLERFSGASLVEARLETGRTHQIRVHMAFLGHPVMGDRTYGPKKVYPGLAGQALHAWKLGFYHPRSGEYLEFTSPLPEPMDQLLTQLREGLKV